jgi:3-oxoacyl-[acyl-carrier-protein] synthase-3
MTNLMQGLKGTKITGIGGALPATVVTNADLEILVDTSDDWITSRTGIKQRRVVDTETCTSLSSAAALDAMRFAGVTADQIDMIIVATSTPDYLYPSTACLVQKEIGAVNAAAFDLAAACTGITYALTVADQFIKTGFNKTVLVIGADLHSRFLDWSDRNTCVLFGDGAGAFILQASDTESDIIATYLKSEGKSPEFLSIPNLGTNYQKPGEEKKSEASRFVQMNGKAVYEFTVSIVPEAIKAACKQASLGLEDIDYFILHQANLRIIKAVAAKLSIPEKKLVIAVDSVGNTGAGSIPLALKSAVESGQIVGPAKCAFIGFGGGLTWGVVIADWNAVSKAN